MKYSIIAAAAVVSFVTPTFTQNIASYDQFYNNGSTSLDTVVCSNGPYGLESFGYQYFKDIPSFPNIGGAPAIQGWNSLNCGSCWQLTYPGPYNQPLSVVITAINSGGPETFIISEAALDAITGGRALTLDNIPITATQVTCLEA